MYRSIFGCLSAFEKIYFQGFFITKNTNISQNWPIVDIYSHFYNKNYDVMVKHDKISCKTVIFTDIMLNWSIELLKLSIPSHFQNVQH